MEAYLEIEFYEGSPSKIYVKASNGSYSGYTDTYTNENWLSQLADELTSFPNEPESIVIFESEKDKKEESDLYLKFYSTNTKGGAQVRVCMKKGIYAASNTDEAKFNVNFEISALDKFVKSLKHIIKNGEGISILSGVQ